MQLFFLIEYQFTVSTFWNDFTSDPIYSEKLILIVSGVIRLSNLVSQFVVFCALGYLLGYHMYLISNNLTFIDSLGEEKSKFDKGSLMSNIEASFSRKNPILWFIPV